MHGFEEEEEQEQEQEKYAILDVSLWTQWRKKSNEVSPEIEDLNRSRNRPDIARTLKAFNSSNSRVDKTAQYAGKQKDTRTIVLEKWDHYTPKDR